MHNPEQEIFKNIETRLKTTMIGSLAKFEEYFGYLWEEDNKNRLEYENLWEQARTSILNNGNNQIRLALDELEDFLERNHQSGPRINTFKQKYRYKFYFKNGEDQ
jgi:hypothetical protein